jgi:hypothetical protein
MTKGYLMNNLVEKVNLNRLIFQYLLNFISIISDAVARPRFPVNIKHDSSLVFTLTYAENHRFMGLNDLMTEIKQDPASFQGDEPVENKVLNMVLSLVEDKISEVKNQAVKWFVCSSPSVVIRHN